jgi:hypothetical protein
MAASRPAAARSTSGGWLKARRMKPAPALLALSRRPGTTATPCLSAAWANALLSASPGSRAHRHRPPSGSGQVQPGRLPRRAAASASCRARSHSPRHLTMSSCWLRSSAATVACWKAGLPRSVAALAAASRAIRPVLPVIQPVRSPPQYSLDSEPTLTTLA